MIDKKHLGGQIVGGKACLASFLVANRRVPAVQLRELSVTRAPGDVAGSIGRHVIPRAIVSLWAFDVKMLWLMIVDAFPPSTAKAQIKAR